MRPRLSRLRRRVRAAGYATVRFEPAASVRCGDDPCGRCDYLDRLVTHADSDALMATVAEVRLEHIVERLTGASR